MSALLALVGTALLLLGVWVDEGALVVIGPGALLLAVLASVAAEFSLGPSGLSLKFRKDDLETGFRGCAELLEPSLTTVVTRIGDGDDPRPIVEEALARSYLEWDGDRRALREHALCTVVRLVLASAKRDGRDLPHRKAVVVLRDEQDLDWETVARILGLTVEEARRHAEQQERTAP